MKLNRKITGRPPRASVMAVLEAHLNRQDEAAWYAERIERLGQILFGGLWRSDARQNITENEKLL